MQKFMICAIPVIWVCIGTLRAITLHSKGEALDAFIWAMSCVAWIGYLGMVLNWER